MPGARRSALFCLLAVWVIVLYSSTPPTRSANLSSSHKDIEGKGESFDAGTTQELPSTTSDSESGAPQVEKWWFQGNLDEATYPRPTYNVRQLRQYRPHNAKGAGQPTFGLYYSTRDGALNDPYFMGAQQIIYRLLWDPRSRSTRNQVCVWVAPFVSEEHRDILRAAGAEVRELALIEYTARSLKESRWKDMFSKLNLWKETDFSRIVFIDTDAFPVENIDGLLDIAEEEQQCNRELLSSEDHAHADALCDYVFVAPHGEDKELTAGVLVFKPSLTMYDRLIRESAKTDTYDDSYAEQSFLNHFYHPEGAFPVRWVDREWNAQFTKPEDEGKVKVVHEKLWAFEFKTEHWAAHYFADTWKDMLQLYNSRAFEEARALDGM